MVAFLLLGSVQICSGLKTQKNTSSSHLWSTGARNAAFSRARRTGKRLSEPSYTPRHELSVFVISSEVQEVLKSPINKPKSLHKISIFTQFKTKTTTPYNSLFWPVQKPDMRWQLTVDHQHLNTNRTSLKAAVPNNANLIATIQSAAHSWMATLDLKDEFFIIPLQEKDRKKFGFTWEGVQYTFNRIPQKESIHP